MRVASRVSPVACGSSFVPIPAGPFVFGSDESERALAYRLSAESGTVGEPERRALEASLRARRYFDREPARQTRTVGAYCLARRPVTQREYAEFVRATGHRAPTMDAQTWHAQGFLVHDFEREVRPLVWSEGEPPSHALEHPVLLVSLDDALAYARWRGSVDGRAYDLPTREEWEKAARGAGGGLFPWGDSWDPTRLHWQGTGLAGTTPVGAYAGARGPYGSDDMAGNVFEWTSTREGSEAVLKGCAWDDLAGFCRGAYEHRRAASSRHILVGFRLVWRAG